MSAVASDRPPLRHDALFHGDDALLASTATSFVREGVERGEVVMVNTGSSPVTALLRADYGGHEQVLFADNPIYSTPAVALEGYRRVMDAGLAAGAVGYRAMGFIDFDSSRLPWQEWARYEAAVNRVFEGYPFHTLCPYDLSEVDPVVAAAMSRAHTGIVDEDGWRPNEDYVDPEELVQREELRTPRHPLQDRAPRLVMEPPENLDDLRLELYSATMSTELPRRKVDDFVAAVTEISGNAHRHGAPPVELRLWATGEAALCTVTDAGPGITDPLVGYGRPADPEHGLGLWAARQLCEVLDWETDDRGFTVRAAALP